MKRHYGMAAVISLFATVLCGALLLSGCSQVEKKNDVPDYADERAMAVIAQGYQKRSDYLESLGEDADLGSNKVRKEAIKTEIDNDKELKKASFKDTKMQEDVIAYLNLLDNQLDVVKKYAESDPKYYDEWEKAYDARSAQLKKLVDRYDLTVDDEYRDAFDELIKNGRTVEEKTHNDEVINGLLSSATFEKSDDGYGLYTYTAIVENTSDISFENVFLNVALYDADGVRAEECYADTSAWAPGEKVKFEVMSEVDASRVAPTVSNYSIKE